MRSTICMSLYGLGLNPWKLDFFDSSNKFLEFGSQKILQVPVLSVILYCSTAHFAALANSYSSAVKIYSKTIYGTGTVPGRYESRCMQDHTTSHELKPHVVSVR